MSGARGRPTRSGPGNVPVGPFLVADLDEEAVAARIVDLALTTGRASLVRCFALHVGGLNARNDPDFVRAMGDADLVYADGGSVVLLARLAGAAHIGRAPTTTLGWDVLSRLTEREGAPPRVALVGGAPGLADRAGAVFAEHGIADPVIVEHGYHDDWAAVTARVRAASPTLVIVGLGAPAEMLWVQRWGDQLGSTTVLTSGGWFGFVAGEEQRAPRVLRRSGLEWVARVAQSPTRLAPRYARGIVSTASLAPAAVRARRATRATA